MAAVIRHAEPDDHARAVAVVDAWWGGRTMAPLLQKLFFVHFRDTSFVAEKDGELAGFLCGFRSQTHADEGYVHFVGVDPARRSAGLGRELYGRFYDAIRPRTVVRAITSTVNEGSLAFHRAIGFEVEGVEDDHYLFVRRLG